MAFRDINEFRKNAPATFYAFSIGCFIVGVFVGSAIV